MNLDEAIKLVGQFPKTLLPKGVAFETSGEKELIKSYQYFYQGLELWFEHFILHKSLAPEAIFTNWINFKSHAEMDTALLDLATGLYPRIPWLQERFCGEDGPIVLWFYAMLITCRNTIIESGLLGKPSLAGKDEFQTNNLTVLNQLNEHSIQIYLPQQKVDTCITREVSFTDCPETYLAMLASHLARQDNNFAEEYWQPYEKVTRRCTRKIRSNPKIQGGALLPNGELFVTGRNKKIPSSLKESKGKDFKKR